jgi:methylated-DNA-[protein]-cysteine S-methyltransferase
MKTMTLLSPMEETAVTENRSHTVVGSPIGELTLVASADGLCGLYLPDHVRRPELATFGPALAGPDAAETFGPTIEQLNEYFAGRRTTFTVPLAPVGTAFQQQVWRALTLIPYGQTRSYGQLAETLGGPRVVRAVGAANGRNPISIIVACHRVIGSTGSLTGYAGGLARKRYLLELEGGGGQPALDLGTGTAGRRS